MDEDVVLHQKTDKYIKSVCFSLISVKKTCVSVTNSNENGDIGVCNMFL